jgi:aminobenzoyl-glutamate utilization protein B
MKETKSLSKFIDYAQEQGFRVTRGVNEIPTALSPNSIPIIGVLGEFDAILDFSLKAQPTKEVLGQRLEVA